MQVVTQTTQCTGQKYWLVCQKPRKHFRNLITIHRSFTWFSGLHAWMCTQNKKDRRVIATNEVVNCTDLCVSPIKRLIQGKSRQHYFEMGKCITVHLFRLNGTVYKNDFGNVSTPRHAVKTYRSVKHNYGALMTATQKLTEAKAFLNC